MEKQLYFLFTKFPKKIDDGCLKFKCSAYVNDTECVEKWKGAKIMKQNLLNRNAVEELQSSPSLTESLLLKTSIETQNSTPTPLPDELFATSYAIIGKKKSSKQDREEQTRRKKTFVQKVFLELVSKFSEEDLQALLYLDFYQELCSGITPQGANNQSLHFLHRPMSPYFISEQKGNQPPSKVRHASLKLRFLKMAHKRIIAIRPKDHFQLACTLSSLWEQAIRIVEQQNHVGSTLHIFAEQLVAYGKLVPPAFCPLEEKKNLVHISSYRMTTKSVCTKVKADQSCKIQEFIDIALQFGYEYFGIAEL